MAEAMIILFLPLLFGVFLCWFADVLAEIMVGLFR